MLPICVPLNYDMLQSALFSIQDMMHGTLEVKQDALTADAVKRPEWMDEVAAEEMTEEQKKVLPS